MRFFEKISKSGMFSDKRFEHIYLKQLVTLGEEGVDIIEKLNKEGETIVEVDYFGKALLVDVSLYTDGIVRNIAKVNNDKGEAVELGRLLIDENTFFGTLNYFKNKK